MSATLNLYWQQYFVVCSASHRIKKYFRGKYYYELAFITVMSTVLTM